MILFIEREKEGDGRGEEWEGGTKEGGEIEEDKEEDGGR